MTIKNLSRLKQIEKKTLLEIGVYLIAVAIVCFAFSQASRDLHNAGKRTTAVTLATESVREELQKIKDPNVPIETYFKTVDLLISHGRITEAQTLLIKRLNHIRAQESKNIVLEEILLLRRLAASNIKMMKFEDAQLILKEAAKLAERISDQEQQILISTELMDVYTQYAKFAANQTQRKGAENFFNKELEHLNKLAEAKMPDERVQRLIHNRHRVGLIEMNRFLELDNFELEPRNPKAM
jgi:hypothetical protein